MVSTRLRNSTIFLHFAQGNDGVQEFSFIPSALEFVLSMKSQHVRATSSSCILSISFKTSIKMAWCIAFLGIVGTVSRMQAQSAHFSGVQATVPTSSSLSSPYGIAIDGSGNIYIADSGNGRILKETLSGHSYIETTAVSGLSDPESIAIDSDGNLYITDTGSNRVLKETLLGGSYSESVVGSGFLTPNGIAVDNNKNVYIADAGNNRVLKETFSNGTYTETQIRTVVLSNANSIAVDNVGNVYICDLADNLVLKETFFGGTYTEGAVGGFYSPTGITVDGSGTVYFFDLNLKSVLKQTPSGSSFTSSIMSLNGVSLGNGVALDASGNVYVTDAANNRIVKSLAGGGNFGIADLGSQSSVLSLIFGIDSASVSIGAPAVLTQGVSGLDFVDAGTGSCTTNGTGYVYSSGQTCTVDVVFSPKVSGARYGAAVLKSISGNVIATGYVYGKGSGPQVSFAPGAASTILSEAISPFGIAVDCGRGYLSHTNSQRL